MEGKLSRFPSTKFLSQTCLADNDIAAELAFAAPRVVPLRDRVLRAY
jgi:hypothetical protein